MKKRANYNSICETPEQHDMSVVEKIRDNLANNRFGSLLLPAYEDDNSSSSSSTTSNDHEVEFRDDYYDLFSPGTVKDSSILGVGNKKWKPLMQRFTMVATIHSRVRKPSKLVIEINRGFKKTPQVLMLFGYIEGSKPREEVTIVGSLIRRRTQR
ncbi:hypothetical protein L1987_38436 [Smallanthus sonchifolius]|uniref:Uncharacterized protein n=1 Tax=Smallanthus sonchifolius TaxID=185202 RepID=A0ACB9HLQ1_9ASTR|nr:hypothetical protein L1987_38436 [Smallanthus sonchifolius]